MIVQIDADPAEELSWTTPSIEPDRIQIALRLMTSSNGYARGSRSCPQRWLLTVAGDTYYKDNPDEDWD